MEKMTFHIKYQISQCSEAAMNTIMKHSLSPLMAYIV